MPVTPYEADDLFTVRVRKYLDTNPDNKWVNSYEFQALDAGDEGDLLALGTKVVAFEQGLHYENVVFEALLISTWVADSVPYDPFAFISSPLTGFGTRAPDAEELLGLSNCMDVRRFAATGRYGHLFYRGCLVESEVSAPAGKTIITERPAMQAIVDAALGSSGLDDHLGTGSGTLRMCMIGSSSAQVRTVNLLSVGQVAQVKQDHRWFNRTSP